jgi:hypothetical protein
MMILASSKRLWLGVLVLLAAVGIAVLLAAPSSTPRADSASMTTTGMHTDINWANPLPGSSIASSPQAAAGMVAFPLLLPSHLPAPDSVYVASANSGSASDQEVAMVFKTSNYGQFMVLEDWIPSMTEQDLQARVNLNPGSAQSESDVITSSGVTFSLQTIRGGITAVLESPEAGSDGTAPLSLEWLENGVNITVIGPSGSFTPASANSVANAM